MTFIMLGGVITRGRVDEKHAKSQDHLRAVKGCENARFSLALFEHNTKRANEHLMIAAQQGIDDAFGLIHKEYNMNMGRIHQMPTR